MGLFDKFKKKNKQITFIENAGESSINVNLETSKKEDLKPEPGV